MITICRARREATLHELNAAAAAAAGQHRAAATHRLAAANCQREAEEHEAKQAKTHDEEQRQKWIAERLQASNDRREERKTTSRAREAELDAAHRRAAAREEAYTAAHPPAAARPVTPAPRPAGKNRKPSPAKAKRPPLDGTAQRLAEAAVPVATYTPAVFLEAEYAAYALAYFTRCAHYDCPGRPEHAAEGAAAAYLHLVSRDYGKTKNRISSHLHALRSAKYQARRRNWYAPQREDKDNRSKDKRQYCSGMGSAYQYGANPATIFWAIEKAERTAQEFAEMTGRPRRDAIWEGSRTEKKRGLPLHTREVALTDAREILSGPNNYRLPIRLECCTIEEA